MPHCFQNEGSGLVVVPVTLALLGRKPPFLGFSKGSAGRSETFVPCLAVGKAEDRIFPSGLSVPPLPPSLPPRRRSRERCDAEGGNLASVRSGPGAFWRMIGFFLCCSGGIFDLPSSWGLGESGVALGTLVRALAEPGCGPVSAPLPLPSLLP